MNSKQQEIATVLADLRGAIDAAEALIAKYPNDRNIAEIIAIRAGEILTFRSDPPSIYDDNNVRTLRVGAAR